MILDPRWSWINENPSNWSLADVTGLMMISTAPSDVGGENLLVQNLPPFGFWMETHLYFEPSSNFQGAGLVAFGDADNMLTFGRAYCDLPACAGNAIYFDYTKAGAWEGSNFQTVVTDTDEAYLRMLREGNTYFGFYRETTSKWLLIGSHEWDAAVDIDSIGITAAQGYAGYEDAYFDYFQINDYTTPYDYYWDDDFSGTALHPLWSWVREDGAHWSLANNPGFMRILTQEGGIFEVTGSNNQKNILLMQAPQNDLQLTTLVTIDPSENFQHAALMVYEDDDNYVEINRAYSNGNHVNFDIEIGGVLLSTTPVVVTADTLYLRIVRAGNLYTGYYSLDGVGWDMVGSGTADLSGALVGIGASNGASTTEILADFDEFHLEGDYPYFEYPWIDDFDLPTLAPRWWWMNENPSNWSLTDYAGYMTIATADYGVGGENLLLQRIPNFDFWMETQVIFQPSSDFQIASLVVFGDTDNYLSFGRAYCEPSVQCVGNGIYFDHVEGGIGAGGNFKTIVPESDTAYLGILQEGTTYFGFYRNEDSKWLLIGLHDWTAPVGTEAVGITAAQGYFASDDALFDYFEITPDIQYSYLPFGLKP
jgi:beta-xylosidase